MYNAISNIYIGSSLRHFASQLSGQHRTSQTGHRHHPPNLERPFECHQALPGHATITHAAPLPDPVQQPKFASTITTALTSPHSRTNRPAYQSAL